MSRILTALAAGLLLLAGGIAPLGAQDALSGEGREASLPAAWSDAGQPDSQEAPEATYSYYYVVGMQFLPRVSSTQFAYDFDGCIHLTAGTDNRLTFPLLLPQGSLIDFVRIYFRDTNAATDLTVWLTTYDAGTGSTDLVSVSSSGSAGYGTVLSTQLSATYNSSLNYTLIVAPNVNSSTVQICGVRVAYWTP